MKRNSNTTTQLALNLDFEPLTKWPQGYKEGLDYEDIQQNVFGLDIETEGLSTFNHTSRIISIAIATRKDEDVSNSAQGFIINHKDTQVDVHTLGRLSLVLSDSNNLIIGHNFKFDLNWLRVKLGIEFNASIFDTLLAQYLLDENNLDNTLGALTDKYIPELKGYKDVVDRSRLNIAAKDDVLIYNCKDADASRRLFDVFTPKLIREGVLELHTVASQVLNVLSKMETRGVYLDKEYAQKSQVKLFESLVNKRVEMCEVAGISFDPNKPKHLKNLLYNTFKFTPTKFTETDEPSVDAEAVASCIERATPGTKEDTVLRTILEFKKEIKLATTYYQPIPRWTAYDGRVHTNYSLGKQRDVEGSGGTVTGRLSSSDPNLQNIPSNKEVRGMFAATPGYIFVDGDYSGLELRVAAFLSREPAMIKAFNEGMDLHTLVMSELRNQSYDELVRIVGNDAIGIPADKDHPKYWEYKNLRVGIKRINFGILYGVQAERLQKLLKLEQKIDWSLEECDRLIQEWLARFSKVAQWIKSTQIQAATYGYVTMPLGMKRRLPLADFKTSEGRRALRQATNFPVQSFASWICLIGLLLLDNYIDNLKQFDIEGGIVLQVHDSVSFEVQDKFNERFPLTKLAEDVNLIMTQDVKYFIRDVFGVKFDIPLEFPITTGERWS